MKCHEFREIIREIDRDLPETVCEHAQNCPECMAWMEEQLKSPPENLCPPQWEAPDSGLFEKIELSEKASETHENWAEVFVSGLKWGMSIGIALTVFIAIITARDAVIESPGSLADSAMAISFVEPSSDCVFFDIRSTTTESWSFLEKDASITFLERNEEELWLSESLDQQFSFLL